MDEELKKGVKKVRVRAICRSLVCTGLVSLPAGTHRISDLLNAERHFLALSEASIVSKEFTTDFQRSFILLNTQQIEAVEELEETD